MTFTSLGLSEPLARAVADLGYDAPTPVQREAIPAVLRGRDVWACARTGSGKTAAFVLPLLHALSAHPGRGPRQARVLVLVPTRELAAQISEAMGRYGRYLPRPLKTCLAVGGVSANPQMMALRGGADLVVATPGRALDLAKQNALRLSSVETLVLDEADRLLSLGFADELTRLLALLPARRQNLLFSATFPQAVQTLAAQLLHEPTRISVEASEPPAGAPEALPAIEQRAIEVDTDKRTLLLRRLLETHEWSHVLVFVASRHGADHVALKLNRAGILAAALHGELSQGARTQALADFQARRVKVLVATDVAARGLDIAHLPAVVNYDLPRSTVDYLHRIGRTGRAGKAGVAVNFVTASTEAHFRLIERRHHLALPRERIAGFEPTELTPPALDPHGGVKGKRKSKKDKLREAAAAAARGPTRKS
ncbi:DEAD/DEAH box helicase [Hyalangium sp.]|uniref:DEAD/DEAH box helicase n=1 Tax=Hyalangium sp. TaxID=2028555 RepID=UPI002D4190D9|nr:DEAD/DEAH box helicase [Hyalangium sp.]HYH96573.1 DEAD/DEAH box helicase [Hyalangium sp.]